MTIKILWFTYLVTGLILFPLFRQRIFEYKWVCKNLGSKPMRILEVGCSGSLLSLYLTSNGHQVYGIDLRDYFVSQILYFNFVKADARKLPFPNDFFDRIIAVSVIEHIGQEWDRTFIPEMCRVLKMMVK
jgi:ubiquinone/menaquinone biosynthesis C-methylase UbiE